MRTIFLTSAGFRTPKLQVDLIRNLTKPPAELKLAHILTASKVSESKDFVERDRQALKELGFQIEEVDIEGENPESLRKLFSGQDVLYVQGGETFYLLKHVRRSGFDKVVKKLLDRGVIYIGVSAGSYVACPTIEMSTWRNKGRNRYGLRSLRAMNLVPFLLGVHYNREKYREGLKEGIASTKYPVKILTDNQALVIRDGRVQMIGEGEEVDPANL